MYDNIIKCVCTLTQLRLSNIPQNLRGRSMTRTGRCWPSYHDDDGTPVFLSLYGGEQPNCSHQKSGNYSPNQASSLTTFDNKNAASDC